MARCYFLDLWTWAYECRTSTSRQLENCCSNALASNRTHSFNEKPSNFLHKCKLSTGSEYPYLCYVSTFSTQSELSYVENNFCSILNIQYDFKETHIGMKELNKNDVWNILTQLYHYQQEVYWTEIGLFDLISRRDAVPSNTLCTRHE